MTRNDIPDDFVDLLHCLREENCDFLIVGAHALAAHGAPRATGDLDILIRPDASNAERCFRALVKFGTPLAAHGVSAADFAGPGNVYQMGLPPHRIDLLTEISGVSFDEAASDPLVAHLGDEEVRCIGLDALIANKRASGRLKDLADVETLEELRARRHP